VRAGAKRLNKCFGQPALLGASVAQGQALPSTCAQKHSRASYQHPRQTTRNHLTLSLTCCHSGWLHITPYMQHAMLYLCVVIAAATIAINTAADTITIIHCASQYQPLKLLSHSLTTKPTRYFPSRCRIPLSRVRGDLSSRTRKGGGGTLSPLAAQWACRTTTSDDGKSTVPCGWSSS